MPVVVAAAAAAAAAAEGAAQLDDDAAGDHDGLEAQQADPDGVEDGGVAPALGDEAQRHEELVGC